MSIRSRFSVAKAVYTAFFCRLSLSVTNRASRSCPDISFRKAKSHMVASYHCTADRTSDAEDERHTRLIVLDSQKIQRGHRVSSLVFQTSDSTTLTLPVVQIAEGTVLKYRQVLDTWSILEDDPVLLGVLESRVCSLRVQDGRCHKLTRQRRRFPRQVRAELGRRIANGPDDLTIIGH
jgi:hypothetical protein